MTYLGVDPGTSGGIAVLQLDGRTHHWIATKMPVTNRDLYEFLAQYKINAFAVVEQVSGHVAGNRAIPGLGASMFRFGVNYGAIRMALTALAIPFEQVVPRTWQKELGVVPGKGEKKSAFKNRLKAKAQALFPGVHLTLATSDALLLAEFARRLREGKLRVSNPQRDRRERGNTR